jgi:hypothetical protein
MQEIFPLIEKNLLPTAKNNIFIKPIIIGNPHSERGASTSGATAFAQLMHMDAARDRPRQRSTLPSRRWKLRIARSSP